MPGFFSNTLAVLRREIYRVARQPMYWLLTVILPIVAFAFFAVLLYKGVARDIPKGCSDSGRHIPQRYGPDRKGAETKRGGNTPLFNHIVQPGLISLYRCGGRNPPPGAVLRPIPTAPDGRSETP